MPPEIQVFEGDGTRYTKPRKPRPVKFHHGRISFKVDDFPVSFKYKIEEQMQGGRICNQQVQFQGAGNIFWANSYTYPGEPRPKGQGYCGDDGNNYHAILWELTRENLIKIFMGVKGDVVRARVAHRREIQKEADMKAKVKIEVQMFDGDGVEPPEIKHAREIREREEKEAAQAAAYEAKKLKRELDYKHSLKSHPLFIPCVRFDADKSADHKHTRMTLTIISTTPPESFNHIVGINRPKITIRYPENVMRDPMQAPVQWDICNPVVSDFKYEKLPLPACQDDARTLFDPLYRYTLKMGFSKILNRSKEAYDEQRKLHASIPTQ